MVRLIRVVERTFRSIPCAPWNSYVAGFGLVLGLVLTEHRVVAAGNVAELVGPLGELAESDRVQLAQLLYQAGLRTVAVRSVERSPERQVRVMLALAEDDLDKAKAMYCDAGDAVLDAFNPGQPREKNAAAMLARLIAELPRAREMGCLNHIENDDVVSVDVRVSDVPAEFQDKLESVALAAVKAGHLVRFLSPPREPDAFHFEFKKRAPSAVKDEPPRTVKPTSESH